MHDHSKKILVQNMFYFSQIKDMYFKLWKNSIPHENEAINISRNVQFEIARMFLTIQCPTPSDIPLTFKSCI